MRRLILLVLLCCVVPLFGLVGSVSAGIEVLGIEEYSGIDSEWGFSASPDASQFTYVDRVMLRSRDVICDLYVVEAETGSKRHVYSAWDIETFTWVGRDDFYFAVRDSADLVDRIKHYKNGVISTVVEGCRFYSLSPDGSRIVYRASYTYNERNARIYIANIDGSEPRLLARGHDPNWLKGDLIALTRIEGDSVKSRWDDLAVLYDLEGHRVKTLGCGAIPKASPDRRYLAFYAHCKGDYFAKIAVVDAEDPGLEVQVLLKGRPSWYPGDFSWAPTSDALVFRADSLQDVSEGELSYVNLCVVDLEGNLTELTPGIRGVLDYDPVWTEEGILFRREGGAVPRRHMKLRLARR